MVTSILQWPEKKIEDWYDFTEALEATLDAFRLPATYIFRGQANSCWPLKPSLLRCMRDVKDRAFARGGGTISRERIYWSSSFVS